MSGIRFLDSWSYAWRTMSRRRGRAVAIGLGYAIIVVTAAAVVAAARATRDGVVRTLWDIGAHTMAFLPRCAGEACPALALDPAREGFEANGAPSRVFSEDVVERLRASPHVADASPYLLFGMRASRGEGRWLVGGFDVSRPKAFAATVAAPSQVTDGRFLMPEDRGAVMLDREFARTHRLRVGDTLSLGTTTTTVVGIVNPPIRPGKAHIYMAVEDARATIAPRLAAPLGDAVNAVLVESRSAFAHRGALADIRRALGDEARFTSFGCGVPGSRAMQVHRRLAGATTLLLAIGMSLLVVRAQAAAVHERRFEIAVLRTIGWSARAVRAPLAIESVLLATTGSLAGAAVAAAIVGLMPRFTTAAAGARLDAFAVLLGLAWATGLGLLTAMAGVATAVRASPAHLLRRP